jgi:hypothetical protein
MNRLWSRVSKVFGGLFMFGGGTVSIGLLIGIAASHATGVALAILSVLLVFFGLAPALLGGWLLYSSAKAEKQALREQFFQLLLAKQGRLSVLDYVATTRLEPAIARRYLDGWAKEFYAEFEVNERGEIYYLFATETMPLPESTNLQLLSQAVRQWLQANI